MRRTAVFIVSCGIVGVFLAIWITNRPQLHEKTPQREGIRIDVAAAAQYLNSVQNVVHFFVDDKPEIDSRFSYAAFSSAAHGALESPSNDRCELFIGRSSLDHRLRLADAFGLCSAVVINTASVNGLTPECGPFTSADPESTASMFDVDADIVIAHLREDQQTPDFRGLAPGIRVVSDIRNIADEPSVKLGRTLVTDSGSLPAIVGAAINQLDRRGEGFWLIVTEECDDDDAAEEEEETRELATAIRYAVDYAEKAGNTAVVVTTPQESLYVENPSSTRLPAIESSAAAFPTTTNMPVGL